MEIRAAASPENQKIHPANYQMEKHIYTGAHTDTHTQKEL